MALSLISDTMNVYLNWFKVIQLDDKLIATRDDDKENSTTTTSIRSSKRQTPSFGIQSSKLYFVKLSERISPKFWILFTSQFPIILMLCLYLKILGQFFNHFKIKLFHALAIIFFEYWMWGLCVWTHLCPKRRFPRFSYSFWQ